MNQYVVITGASQGLGKAFAQELAKQHYSLILVSLPNENLPELSHELKEEFHVDVVYFETDLTKRENLTDLIEKINSNYNVFFLINNAGFGGTKKILDAPLAYIQSMIDLNVVASTTLIHQLLPNLLKQEKAYILNIASLASLTPLAYKTVYPATKAFIHHFSLGLREELKDTNVSVSVVNPGGMATNEEVKQRMERSGWRGKLTALDPKKVAKKCIKQTLQGKRIIVVNLVSWLYMTIFPTRVKVTMISNGIKKELNN